ncbi:tail spike protein [Enterococcus phage EG103P1]|nr:tail spike protein [Enterococcus phage EG103P1]
MITVLSPQGVYRGNYVNNIPNATPYFDDKFTDNLETMQTTLEFAVPLQSEDSEWLEGFGTVLYPDKDNVLRELTIINVWEDWSQEQPLKRVVCEDSSVDALLKSHVVPFTAGNLRDAIAGALRTTPWEYIIGSDTINIGYELVDVKEYTDVRSTLEKIRELYDIEYRFSVKFDGQRITRVLHVYKRFGSNTGKYFVYDRDLINIERTVDFDNIHTAILPYWMEQDVVRTLAGYSPINKINGFRKDYPMDVIIHEAAHNDYDQGDYAKVLIMKSSSTDPELTYLEACNKLLDYIAPTYTYTVNVLLLENALGFEGTEQIHLGDTVWLKEKVGDMELGLEARVVELVTSHNNPEDDQVTFTNFKEISTADSEDVLALRDMINQIQNQQDQINQVVVQVTEDITVLQQGQEGIIEQLGDVPSVSVGDTPTPNPKEGDIWFLDAVDPDTGKTYSTIRIWNETTREWQDRYSAKDAEEAQAAANEAAQAGKDAQAAADAAKEAAQDAAAAGQAALDKANQAVTDAANAKAQADAIQVDVEGLQTDVGKAQTDASKALTDSASAITKVGQVDSKLTTVTNDVNGMKTTITDIETVQGETTQKLTEVETNVNGLTVTVGQVKTTADSALSKATTVETTVNGLKVTVGEVKTTADGAMAKATRVEATADGLKATVTSIQNWQDNFQLGGSNYIPLSSARDKTSFDSFTTSFTKTELVDGEYTKLTFSNYTGSRAFLSKRTPVNLSSLSKDDTLTLSIDVYVESTPTVDGSSFFIRSFKSDGTMAGDSPNVVIPRDLATGKWHRLYTSSKVNATADLSKAVNVTFAMQGNGVVRVRNMKLEKGNKVSDWTPAPEDLATVAKVTQVEATVDGLKTTVSEVQTTANNAFTKATQVEQTASGIQTTVSEIQTDLSKKKTNKDFKSSNTSSSNASKWTKFATTRLTSRYQDTAFGLDIIYNGDGGALPKPSTIYIRHKQQNAMGQATLVEIALTETSTIKSEDLAAVVTSSTTSESVVEYYVRNTIGYSVLNFSPFNEVSPEKITYYETQPFVDTLPTGTQDIVYGKERGNLAGVTGVSSQITQLADQINLKVDKNGVIAQINVSSEGVLIDGKNVWITGLTKIDNAVIKTAHIADLAVSNAKIANLAVNGAKIADASITTAKIGDLQVSTAKIANLAVTDAKIGSLSASKITTGTLDAGKISVINLSASSITSGTLSGLTIQSPYDRPITDGSTTWQRGTLTLSNGLYTNAWETYVKSTGVKNISGKLIIDHQALSSYQLDSSGQLEYNMQLSPYALTLQTKDGKGGSFSYNDLYSMPRTGLQPASGFEQYSTSSSSGQWPTATRLGRLVQLAGAFKNINPIAGSADVLQMGILPIWARPNQTTNVIAQGSGMNRYLLGIEPGGAINMSRYGSGSSYEQVGKGSWLNIATTYAGADV